MSTACARALAVALAAPSVGCHAVVELEQPTWPSAGTVIFATASADTITRRWVLDAADARRFPLEFDSVFVAERPKLLTATHACPPATLGLEVGEATRTAELTHPALLGFDTQTLALDDPAPTWSAPSAVAARDDDLASRAAGRLAFDEAQLCASLGASLSARELSLPADLRAIGPAVRAEVDRVIVLVETSTGARALVVDPLGNTSFIRLTRTATTPRARVFGPLLASDGHGRLVLADEGGLVAVGDLARGLVDEPRLRLPQPRASTFWSQLLFVGDTLVLTDSAGHVFVANDAGWSQIVATATFQGTAVGVRALDARTLVMVRAPDGAATTTLDPRTGRASRPMYFFAQQPLPADLIPLDDGWFVFAHQIDFTGALATGDDCTALRGIDGQTFRVLTETNGEVGARPVVGSAETDLMYSAIERLDDERVVWSGARSFLLCDDGIRANAPPRLGVWHLLGPHCPYTGAALPSAGRARQIVPLAEGRALVRYESPPTLIVVEANDARASCFTETFARRVRPTRGHSAD